MLVLIRDTADEGSNIAASLVARALKNQPTLTLGLAAGDTVIGLYRNLVDRHRSGVLDFSCARFFSLDELLGLPKDSPHTYRSFFHRHLVDHINIDQTRLFFVGGETMKDPALYCASYEDIIRVQGGIALQILGIGENGHLGFNEPGCSLNSRTRLTLLMPSSREDVARSMENQGTVRWAITMGLATIREANVLLLLAFGKHKAEAVAKALEGPITASLPASSIQLHPTVIVVLDREASSLLTNQDFYFEQACELSSLLPGWLK